MGFNSPIYQQYPGSYYYPGPRQQYPNFGRGGPQYFSSYPQFPGGYGGHNPNPDYEFQSGGFEGPKYPMPEMQYVGAPGSEEFFPGEVRYMDGSNFQEYGGWNEGAVPNKGKEEKPEGGNKQAVPPAGDKKEGRGSGGVGQPQFAPPYQQPVYFSPQMAQNYQGGGGRAHWSGGEFQDT